MITTSRGPTVGLKKWTVGLSKQVICLLRRRFLLKQPHFLDELITEEWCSNLPQILLKKLLTFKFRVFPHRPVILPNLESLIYHFIYIYIYILHQHLHFGLQYTHTYDKYVWCTGYRRRIWTRRHEFKSWTWLIAFHIALIPLGKVWIQIFSLQLWVNSRAD